MGAQACCRDGSRSGGGSVLDTQGVVVVVVVSGMVGVGAAKRHLLRRVPGRDRAQRGLLVGGRQGLGVGGRGGRRRGGRGGLLLVGGGCGGQGGLDGARVLPAPSTATAKVRVRR
jgi:hypothetical protein